MQMLCKVSAGFSDVRCPVCGQGFLVYWTRQREIPRAEQRQALQTALRGLHAGLDSAHGTDGADMHPPTFHLPDVPMPLPQRLPQAMPSTAVPLYS